MHLTLAAYAVFGYSVFMNFQVVDHGRFVFIVSLHESEILDINVVLFNMNTVIKSPVQYYHFILTVITMSGPTVSTSLLS